MIEIFDKYGKKFKINKEHISAVEYAEDCVYIYINNLTISMSIPDWEKFYDTYIFNMY